MPVERKIAEAERWFRKIEQSYPNERLELHDNVIAFLNAINSIPDHLLEDYNVKFGLSIPVNTTSFRREFGDKVKQSNDQILLEFYSWFETRRKFIEKEDKICTILSQKRHINIHRFTAGPTINTVSLHFPINLTDEEFQIPSYQKPGSNVFKIRSKKSVIKRKIMTVHSDPPTLDLYFEELREVNVKDACRYMLETMKNLVTDTQNKFPIENRNTV